MVDIITVEDLSSAIEETTGLDSSEAERDAEFVMDIFGFNDRIIDNVLEPEDRQLFYMFEEWGLLTTEREETTLYDGREWRTHYWMFRKDEILGYAEKFRERMEQAEEDDTVYDDLPEELWATREQ
jgi:hypothetical protein